MQTDELVYWLIERETIRAKKESGQQKPWTEDPILRKFRFCNYRRELDAVTRWVHENWLVPNATDPDVWFAMVVARFFNLPSSLNDLGYPVPWNPEHCREVMLDRAARGLKNYNAAYMIRSTSGSKTEHLIKDVFTPLWQSRELLRPKRGDTLTSYHFVLGQFYGLGSFLTGQVIADIKHVEPLRSASDWFTFACSGPGSRRGMNRILGYSVTAAWREDDWRLALTRLQGIINPRLVGAGLEELCGQNTQSSLCEIDKYLRIKLGEGRPKQLYPGV